MHTSAFYNFVMTNFSTLFLHPWTIVLPLPFTVLRLQEMPGIWGDWPWAPTDFRYTLFTIFNWSQNIEKIANRNIKAILTFEVIFPRDGILFFLHLVSTYKKAPKWLAPFVSLQCMKVGFGLIVLVTFKDSFVPFLSTKTDGVFTSRHWCKPTRWDGQIAWLWASHTTRPLPTPFACQQARANSYHFLSYQLMHFVINRANASQQLHLSLARCGDQTNCSVV